MWELKTVQELSEWPAKQFCALPGELEWDLAAISVSDLGPVLSCSVKCST